MQSQKNGVTKRNPASACRVFAVEFPLPCDRSEFAFPPLCLQEGWNREDSTPLKERNLYRQTLPKKDWGLSIGLV
jgi:hypothetical protein